MDRLESRIAGVALRGSVQAADDSQGRQLADVELLADDVVQAEVFEPYGFSGVLPVGAAGVSIQIGADAGHGALVCAAPRGSRPTGRASGEVTMYSVHGQRIDLFEDGTVRIAQSDDANAARIEIALSGDILISGGALVAVDADRVVVGADGGIAQKANARQGDTTAMDAGSLVVLNKAIAEAAAGVVAPIAGLSGTITSGSGTVESA